MDGPGNRGQHGGAAGTSTEISHGAAIVVIDAGRGMPYAIMSVTGGHLTPNVQLNSAPAYLRKPPVSAGGRRYRPEGRWARPGRQTAGLDASRPQLNQRSHSVLSSSS